MSNISTTIAVSQSIGLATLKNAQDTAIASINEAKDNILAAAETGTDSTLTVSGLSADAAVVGQLLGNPQFSTDWVTGQYVSYTGAIGSSASYQYCKIDVSAYAGLAVTFTTYIGGTGGWAFWDTDDKVISALGNAVPAPDVYTYTETIPVNANYLLISCRTANSSSFHMQLVELSQHTAQVIQNEAALSAVVTDCVQGSGYVNLTADTQEEICSSDMNQLPVNRIYPVGTDCTAANMPVSDGGIVATLSRRNGSLSVGTTQLFISRGGRMFTRTYWGGSWGAWTEYATDSDLTLAVQGLKTNITASTASELCESDANNLPNNRIYGIGLTELSDCANLPAVNGVLVTIGKSNNRTASDTQLFIQRGGAMWSRTYWASTWTPWIRSDHTQLLNILCVGDSIAYGARNSHKGFVGDLGLPYKIVGLVGATLSNQRTDVTNIPDQLTEVSGYVPDIILADGGVNDYYYDATLGDIPLAPITTDSDAEALNRDTVMGGLQYLLYKMITLYPDAQRFFVLTHKTLNWPYTANAAGYTQTDLFEAIRTVCALYSTKVIDIFSESCIHTGFDVYKSDISYNTDASVTDTEWVDSDGIHPLAYGYLHGYVPLIRQALQLASVN